MGIEDIDELKPPPEKFTTKVEQFPDGVHEVPLNDANGEKIGDAVLTFKNGAWTAELKTDVEGFKSLGLEVALLHTTFLNGETLALHVRPQTSNEARQSIKMAMDNFEKTVNDLGKNSD